MPTPSRQLRRINEPVPLTVSCDAAHRPTAIHVAGHRKAVATIHDMWIITDEWWRDPPIDRQYFKVVLQDGQITTVFRDRHANRWFEQDYTHPQDIGVKPGGSWD